MKLKTDKEVEMTVKEWWASCPAKKTIMLLAVVVIALAIKGVYEFGYDVGQALYYIIH